MVQNITISNASHLFLIEEVSKDYPLNLKYKIN